MKIKAGVLFMACLLFFTQVGQALDNVSGHLVDGLRVLPADPAEAPFDFTVYRGDYIRFDVPKNMDGKRFIVPDLEIRGTVASGTEGAEYFKMKQPGRYAFSIGEAIGHITVKEYEEPHYKAVTAPEAMQLIQNVKPLVLDVRTKREFDQVHLENAVLVPVQELSRRVNELAVYKNQDVLIYCATGNRSTVASKILIDSGFNRIYNLRYGIKDWLKKKLPVTR